MRTTIIRGLLIIAEVGLGLLVDHVRQRRALNRQKGRPLQVITGRYSDDKRGRTLPAAHTIRDRRRAI